MECLVEIFFPFDPYLLKESSVFIRPTYREWEEIDDQVGDEEDKHNSGSDDDHETSSQRLEATSPMSFTPDFSADVFAYLNQTIGSRPV